MNLTQILGLFLGEGNRRGRICKMEAFGEKMVKWGSDDSLIPRHHSLGFADLALLEQIWGVPRGQQFISKSTEMLIGVVLCGFSAFWEVLLPEVIFRAKRNSAEISREFFLKFLFRLYFPFFQTENVVGRHGLHGVQRGWRERVQNNDGAAPRKVCRAAESPNTAVTAFTEAILRMFTRRCGPTRRGRAQRRRWWTRWR